MSWTLVRSPLSLYCGQVFGLVFDLLGVLVVSVLRVVGVLLYSFFFFFMFVMLLCFGEVPGLLGLLDL